MNNYLKSQIHGFEVYIDRYIGKENNLSFISCFGTCDSVKAAMAGYAIYNNWSINGVNYERPRENISFSTQKLTASAAHGIIYIPSLYNFTDSAISVVIGESLIDVNLKIFERLKYRTSIPLLDSWQDIIIENLVSKVKLDTFGVAFAYEVELPTDDILKDYIMANLSALKEIK